MTWLLENLQVVSQRCNTQSSTSPCKLSLLGNDIVYLYVCSFHDSLNVLIDHLLIFCQLTNNLIFTTSLIFYSSNNISIHNAWHATYKSAMYYTSQDDIAIIPYFLKFHDICASLIMNM